MEIIHHHVIHYACGCTTTRIEVQHMPADPVPVCAAHHMPAHKEQHISEFSGPLYEKGDVLTSDGYQLPLSSNADPTHSHT